MKIGILGSRGFPSTYGGYETLVRYLARWLVAEGHDVTAYCRVRSEGRRSWVTEDVKCIATAGVDTKSLSTLSFGATSSLDALRRRFDALLVLNIANGFFLPALKASGTPVAVNTDGIEWERGKWGPAAKAVFRGGAAMTARYADALIADSEAIGDIWEQRFGVSSNFVPYGAPIVERSQPTRLAAQGIAPGSYVLVVARLIPENNVELALDAIDLLGEAAPPVVVVGSANFDSPIEARLKQLEAAGRVSWLGHVDDQVLLTELWQHCAIYFHGHSVGGTNPALLQALGCGAPVLALDTVFNRQVLRAPDQLVPRDAEVVAKAFVSTMPDSDRRAEWSVRGQRTIRDRYEWDGVCRRYFEVLERISR